MRDEKRNPNTAGQDADQAPGRERGHASMVVKLAFASIAMFGFGYALVPLYDIFCEVTGIGDSTTTTAAENPERLEPDYDRTITVEFIAQHEQGSFWDFDSEKVRMEVHPGKLYTTHYLATNAAPAPQVAHAVPSVSPSGATQYLRKVECFCFEEQQFEAEQTQEMPVLFYVDPAIPSNISTVTLSYAFYGQPSLVMD